MLDPQSQQLMSLVEQVESMPPEVMELVDYRRKQSEKEQKKQTEAQKDEMTSVYDLMKKYQLSAPVPPPQGQPDPTQAMMLGQNLGNIDPTMLI